MKKTISVALLALAACAPALAKTYELSFTGVFNRFETRHTDLTCEECLITREYQGGIAVPFSGTLNVTLFSEPTVRISDNTYSSYRHISQITTLASGAPQFLPAPLEFDKTVTVPHVDVASLRHVSRALVYEIQSFGQDLNTGTLVPGNRNVSVLRQDIWSASTDTLWKNSFGLSSISRGTVHGSFDAPLNPDSFLAALQNFVGCSGCLQAQIESQSLSPTDSYNGVRFGTATLLSVRELTAPVPEPSSLLLLASGLAVVGGLAWRRRLRGT